MAAAVMPPYKQLRYFFFNVFPFLHNHKMSTHYLSFLQINEIPTTPLQVQQIDN